jgi:hypothetical protein
MTDSSEKLKIHPHDTRFTLAQIERLKREAKKIKKEQGITHTEALDKVALKYEYHSWQLLMRHGVLPEPNSSEIECLNPNPPPKK